MRNRQEIEEFADAMELELLKHDDRPGWKDCDLLWLLSRLKEETDELELAIINREFIQAPKIIAECADVANFAMMIADIVKNDMLKRMADKLGEDFQIPD